MKTVPVLLCHISSRGATMIIEYILGFIAFLALTLALGKRAHEKNQDKQNYDDANKLSKKIR